MKSWIIRTFGLKGSWAWACRQMLKGKYISRCGTGTPMRIDPLFDYIENTTRNSPILFHPRYMKITDWEVYEEPEE